MGKRSYRSTAFDEMDWSAVLSRIEGERVVLAVDVAKEAFMAQLLTEEREVLATVRWRHPQQTRALVETLKGWLGHCRVEVVMEPTGTYGDALRGLLVAQGWPVYRVSPKRVHDAAELYDGVPSLHDAKAANVIGRLHLEGVSEVWEEVSEERREMKALQGLLRLYRGRYRRGLNRLEAQLARHWPEVLGMLALDSVTLLQLLATYGEPGRIAADPEGATLLMGRVGGRGLCADKREAVLASAVQSVGVPCLEAERELIQRLAADVLATREELRKLERRVKAKVERTPVLRRMAAVVGSTTSAVLLATQGSPLDYPEPRSYQKSLGLNLKERSSGQHKGQLKITKRGPSLARQYLYFAALRLMDRDPMVRHWCERKAGRDGGRKGKAVTAVMRKLAKALWYVARGERFETRKLFTVETWPMAA
ncbi:IS110 family transposase [Methylocaldum szegediense]|jgi:transposase|uniref:Transposase n=1 Tax=Methylocaldum szegediense TaxID=73780 RepID=A0ABM9I1Q9_9GAMM|nr:transposase [Methylocaldum szegediense]CAI8832070.1 transposase [Methylocaldum szegediense]CAI8854245.1 transposase [Methylocaldum szegediense]